jgi:hypothetical protein
MTTKKSSTLTVPLVVGGATLVALVAVLALSNAGNLGTRYPAASPSRPARIVDQKYECSAACLCVYDYNVPTPSSTYSKDEEQLAEWTSCVSVRSELDNDASKACKKTCATGGGTYWGHRNLSCNRIGDC